MGTVGRPALACFSVVGYGVRVGAGEAGVDGDRETRMKIADGAAPHLRLRNARKLA